MRREEQRRRKKKGKKVKRTDNKINDLKRLLFFHQLRRLRVRVGCHAFCDTFGKNDLKIIGVTYAVGHFAHAFVLLMSALYKLSSNREYWFTVYRRASATRKIRAFLRQ